MSALKVARAALLEQGSSNVTPVGAGTTLLGRHMHSSESRSLGQSHYRHPLEVRPMDPEFEAAKAKGVTTKVVTS